MPYKTKEEKLAAARRYRRAHPEKAAAWCEKWAKNNREKKNACNRRHAGEPGTPRRERYNEARRVRRKLASLQVLEASRKHRESLWAFLRSKAA